MVGRYICSLKATGKTREIIIRKIVEKCLNSNVVIKLQIIFENNGKRKVKIIFVDSYLFTIHIILL